MNNKSMKTQTPTQAQTLAFTTAALLNSSLPFMLLSLVCTLLAAAAFLLAGEGAGWLWSKMLLLLDLLLALPLAWLSLRMLFDARIMQHWAQGADEPACAGFDQSLQALGLVKKVQTRNLLARARGCVRLQKSLITLAAGQWIVFILSLVFLLIE